MKTLKHIVFTLSLTGFCSVGVAQHPEAKRATHWYFGNGAGLDFSSGTAVAVTDGKLDSWESCASISDTNGNLLFYTDGDTIWDRNHNVMPNGIGLFGNCFPPGPNNSATQGVIIIPQPKSDSLFYIFTVDCTENLGAKGMNYSIVNLSLNGGFGDVTLKNQFLFAPSTEDMAATMNCTRDSVWVVGHDDNNKFYSYLVTEIGVSSTPIISVTSTVFNLFAQMKFSPNGKKLAYQGFVYDFNFKTGKFINAVFVNFDGYGLSFSPDSKKLYFSINSSFIGQYDISLFDSIDIFNSFQTIYSGISNDNIGGMQLSIDGIIYIANYHTTKISKIKYPNNSGIAVNFSLNTVDLNGRKSQFTFPSFIESYFDDSFPGDQCRNTSVFIPNIFTPNNDGINDVFSIQLTGYEKIYYSIFNRWGSLLKMEELLCKNNKTLVLWDGRTFAGNKVTDGIYYYIINLTKKGGETETKKGFVQILN